MNSHEHIVMLPFMAQGHIIPFLSLAIEIVQRTGYIVTIATTPRNIRNLRSTVSSLSTTSTATNIHLVELPFNSSDHGLPPDSENTDSLTLRQVIRLFHASQALQPSFHSLISTLTQQHGRPLLCILSDIFLGWSVDVAKSFGIPHLAFSTGGAYGTAAYMSIWLNLPHRSTDSDDFTLPGFPNKCRFHRSQLHQYLRAADGEDLWSRFFQKQIANSLKSDGLICNTVEEIETFGLEVLRKMANLPVWTIGPLLPQAYLNPSSSFASVSSGNGTNLRPEKRHGVAPERCVEWLNLHEPASVLYISFGSQNTISAPQMMELAKGVELSGKPFIWVIRPPMGFDINGKFRPEWLPEGFEARITERKQGLLVHKWGPQLEILSHKSTGAFLSHCGWNSVLESLSQGRPMIGWPLAAEQAYNVKMLVEEMGVCVELTRGVQSSIDGEEVRKIVEMVMDNKSGKGEEMKRRAVGVSEKLRAAMKQEGDQKGSSLQALDDLVTTLLSRRQ